MKFKIVLLLLIAGCSANIEAPLELPRGNIEVIAPGSDCERDFLKNLPVKSSSYYENDKERAQSVKDALLSSDNDIIWALRGGYGTANVVEILYKDEEFLSKIKENKKRPVVIGYCDITALHLFLSQELAWQTIHGPVFKEITDNNKKSSFDAIINLLNGIKEIKFIGITAINRAAATSDTIVGKLTGGNMSIIQTSIGTKWQIETRDKILFLEDCNEKPYQIARILNHFKAAGILDRVKAIIIGNLCDSSNYMSNTIKDFADTISTPIYSLDVFGHGIYNYPMIYNGDVKISSRERIMILKNLSNLSSE